MNKVMKIKVKEISDQEQELVAIYCYRVDERVRDIISFVKSRQGQLTGSMNGSEYEIPVTEIFYIESVDNRVYIYCKSEVYETRQKLYELEHFLESREFLRVSKSVVLNLMKVESVKPALNGRFLATLRNGEEIIISRKYVPLLKDKIRGGRLV